MATLDRRVRRTRAALAQAMLELARERPFAELTIRELTDRADIGYATFFRHYPSKEALLLDVLGEVVADLAGLLEPMTELGRLEDAGRRLFTYVADNAARLRVLLAAQRGSVLEAELRDAVSKRILASGAFRPAAGVPAELAAHHLAVSSLALVAWWLERGGDVDAAAMGSIYVRLVARPALVG